MMSSPSCLHPVCKRISVMTGSVIVWTKPILTALLHFVLRWIIVMLAEFEWSLLTMLAGSLILGSAVIDVFKNQWSKADQQETLSSNLAGSVQFRAKILPAFEVVCLWMTKGWIFMDILFIVLMLHFSNSSYYLLLFTLFLPGIIIQYLVVQLWIWPYNMLGRINSLAKVRIIWHHMKSICKTFVDVGVYEWLVLSSAVHNGKLFLLQPVCKGGDYPLNLVSPLSLKLMEFLNKQDNFPSSLSSGTKMEKSTATSKHFRKLATCFEMVIPDLIVRSDLQQKNAKGLQSMMSDVIMVADQESLQNFFHKYSQSITITIDLLPSGSSFLHKQLVNYLDKGIHQDLLLAAHSDVKHLVNSLKKGVLNRLGESAQKLHSEVSKDEFSTFLTKTLVSYEWVCKLMSTQGEITNYLEIIKERPLVELERHSLRQLIRANELSEKQTISALNLLEYYGVVKCKEKGNPNYPIYIIQAANLSLLDILEHQTDWSDTKKPIELLILCKECFYIDASLYYSKCKVKNVAIIASKVVVVQEKSKKWVIDVSGSDGKSYDTCSIVSSEIKPGLHGNNGQHGEPGESGGNIMICADEIENSELLVLCSKGGKGGNGQHGGNGRDGKATPSKSDDLSLFGGYEKLQLVRNNLKKTFEGHYKKTKFSSNLSLFSAYGKSLDDVEVLHGSKLTHFLGCYAFLYSRGINGISANGGNAGRGGKAGGGGKGGRIKILMKNCIDHNYDHNVSMTSCDGCDGIAGKPGKPGKRDLAESRRDYLVVDGLAKSVLRYDGFINLHPYTGTDPSRLNRGWYSCDHRVSQCLNSVITTDAVEFFKVKRNAYCPTSYDQQAEDGKEQQHQDEVVHSTPAKPISMSGYLIYLNEFFQVHSNFQLLEELQHTILEKLGELQLEHMMQQHKQIRKRDSPLSDESNLVLITDVDVESILNLSIEYKEKSVSLSVQEIAIWVAKLEKKVDKPGDTKFDITKFENSEVQQKYNMFEEFLEDKLNKLKCCGILEKEDCELVYNLLNVLFNSTFLVHTNRNMSLQTLCCILDIAEHAFFPVESTALSKKRKKMKHNVLLRYKWSKLAQAHEKLLDVCTYSDKEFQQKALYIFRKVHSKNSIEKIDKKYAKWFTKLSPFKKVLKPLIEHSKSADLPLTMDVKAALEILMAFINEANEKKNHFPNIVGAIQREYDAYVTTISNPDILFVITYIEEKLCQLLLSRKQLEKVFCKNFPMNKEELITYKGGFIIYQEKEYKIEAIGDCQHALVIVASRNSTFEVDLKNLTVVLNGTKISFLEALYVSKVDIVLIWERIQKFFKPNELPANGQVFEKFLKDYFSFLPREDQFKLTLLLQQACSAQDLQFDVFLFYPPSQWVEKLILLTVHKQYGDRDPNFVAQIEKKVDGLSLCYDKCLYYTLYENFLKEPSQRGDSFKFELMEVLDKMNVIFIDKKICFQVTEQGLRKAKINNADYVVKELISLEIIDSIGTFFQHISESTIEKFCKSQNIDKFYLKTIFIMQKNLTQLSGKELSFWNLKLGELRLRLLLQQLAHNDSNLCDELLVHVHQMESHFEDSKVLEFIEVLNHLSPGDIQRKQLLELFSKCSRKEWTFSVVMEHITEHLKRGNSDFSFFSALHAFDWNLYRNKERTVKEIIEEIKKSYHHLDSDAEHLFTILDNIERNIETIKKKESYSSVLCTESNLLTSSPLNCFSSDDICVWLYELKMRSSPVSKYVLEIFAVIRRGITLFYETKKNMQGVKPKDTQMVASLLFLRNLSTQGDAQSTKLLQQILTGEGKTMILCMVAIYKVLLGEKVDIVTSSSVLATRDAADLKPLYDMFNITVSHCCYEALASRRKSYEADVVYGDIGSFQRDILETDFYDHDIRTDRGFDNVFVDEVDSMLVDKGQSMLYLPHTLPDMNCLEEVYLVIWSFVNAEGFIGLQQEKEQLYSILKQALFGAIDPSTFSKILGIGEKKSEEYFDYFVNNKTIDSEEHCLAITDFAVIKGHVEKLESNSYIRNEILCMFQTIIEEKPLIQRIPKSLHAFIKKSLKSWIHSAICAKYFRPNKEYIIDIDRRESASDPYPKIVIMDNDTGVEQESSEWGNGLHQFLQLKHNLRLSAESLKAVYMSNISFFTKQYKNLMGVTGTLGSVAEHKLFKQLYNDILIVKLPTNKPSRLIIELPLCFSKKLEWEQAIFRDVQEKLQNNRVVLLICENVEGARYLQQYLMCKSNTLNLLLYVSSHDEKLDERTMFCAGQLIIATNLAGRGTDIKLSEEVKKNGGLHVCLSYLPPNVRVELQAYGRAARSGDPGSCRMIFCSEERDLTYAIQKRNSSEGNRVAGIEVDYFKNIVFQENLFKKFRNLYNEIRGKIHKPEYRAILDYCLDCWAFFLDHYMDVIESIPNKSPREAESEKIKILQAFDSEVVATLLHLDELSFIDDVLPLPPSRLLQLGHAFTKKEIKRGKEFTKIRNKIRFDLAVHFYKQALPSNGPSVHHYFPFVQYYLAAAQFNLAFNNTNTTLFQGKPERRALKQTFYEVIPLFEMKIRQCHDHAIMLQVANRHQDLATTGKINYFQEQKQHEIECYQHFVSSMQAAIGSEITPQMFNHKDWEEKEGRIIFEIICKEFSLKQARIAKNYEGRLKHLLSCQDTYFTYEAQIRDKVKSLENENFVRRDSFIGVLPDKRELWALLKKNNIIITNETETETVGAEDFISNVKKIDVAGYLNPMVDIDSIELDSFDYITVRSFDWIEEFSDDEKRTIYTELIKRQILNSEGRLIKLNLHVPLEINLPDSCVKHYKAIKDTLWHHAIYRFILCHLRDCAEIDEEIDIEQEICNSTATTQGSVVEILKCLYPNTRILPEVESHHHPSEVTSRINSELFVTTSNLNTHVTFEVLDSKFVSQLKENGLTATEVSGSGWISMINAIIQHAKQEYFSPNFAQAYEVQKCIQQKYPNTDKGSMLHCNALAKEVLVCVNSKLSSKIEKVTVFMASSDGLFLYNASDDGITSGKHAVLWQQSNHFTAIVQQHELAESIYQESDDNVKLMECQMKISTAQLKKLENLKILKKSNNNFGKYCICKPLEEIKLILDKADSLSFHEREKMKTFLKFKLEVDYKTLAGSPRMPASNPSHVLYNDLCQYSVIKGIKIKKSSNEIDAKCRSLQFSDLYLITSQQEALKVLAGKKICYLDMVVLNEFLKCSSIEELSSEQYNKLEKLLSERKTTAIIVQANISGNIELALSAIGPNSAEFLSEDQRIEVKKFVLLMLKARKNASFIVSTLKKQASDLLDLETPQITLRRLIDLVDTNIQDRGDVLGWFSDNHRDLLISLGEQLWSWKTISTATTVIAIGAATIILGVVLQIATTGIAHPICGAFISEGISDLMFGIDGLVRGHCNWSQYFNGKKWSVLLSLATAGIGTAYDISRYGFKVFSSVGRALIRTTAEETGIALTKTVARNVGLRIAKKAAKASVKVALNCACERLSETLSQSIEDLRQTILSFLDDMTADADFQQKVFSFLEKHDPDKAEEKLHEALTNLMKHKTFLEFWDGIANTIHRLSAQVLQEASKLLSDKKEIFSLCEHGIRFGPFITESVKINFVKKRINLIKKEIVLQLDQHPSAEDETNYLDKQACDEIFKNEIKCLKQHLSSAITQHGRSITAKAIEVMEESLINQARIFGQEVQSEVKIFKEGFNYQFQTLGSVKESEESHSVVTKYEKTLNRLITHTHNPSILAHLIEHHNAQPNPKLIIPVLEKKIRRPIELFDEKGTPIFNVHEHHGTGEPLEIKFNSKKRNFCVKEMTFLFEEYGSDCLIHCAMVGAGKHNFKVSDIRKEFAKACKAKGHICNVYILNGIVQDCVTINFTQQARKPIQWKEQNVDSHDSHGVPK